MIDIEDYIQLPLEDRRKHLRLDDPCIERGGKPGLISNICKGLLAHVLNTSIPMGRKVLVCHGCNNGFCSNPDHLYWGTPSENTRDSIACGSYVSVKDSTITKYGSDGASKLYSDAGKKGGSAGKGKPKSPEHRAKLAEAARRQHSKKNLRE